MSERITLPVVPLRASVIFPGVAVPIAAGRPGTLRAIEGAVKGDGRVLAVAQRRNLDSPTAEDLHDVGVIAQVSQLQKNGQVVQLLMEGLQRVSVLEYRKENDQLGAVCRPLKDLPPTDREDPAFLALDQELRAQAAELAKKRGVPEPVMERINEAVGDPGAFADLVAGHIELGTEEKQELLETTAVEDRMRRLLVLVQRQLARVQAREDIQSTVQKELGDRQREMYLREQMKAIQRELGDEGEDDETAQLRARLEALELPEEARSEVNRELSRLERTARESAEAQVTRTYLETVAELPWNTRSEEHLDVARAAEVLDEDHYGLSDVKDRVLEFLSVRQLRRQEQEAAGTKASASGALASDDGPDGETVGDPSRPQDEDAETKGAKDESASARGPILLFTGPPGVGKTSVGKSIARALGRKYVRIALGGVRDEADIRGHRRTYVGAMPGRIIQGLKQAGTRNPVVLLDEVDKLGVSYQGNPSAALLEVLDPAQNHTFTDHYLGVPFDLSEVLFIATANFVQDIPAPLLDRMETVEFTGYTEREKCEIAKKYLIPRQLAEAGLGSRGIRLSDEAVADIVTRYTRESGVRQLERKVGAVARKLARRLALGEEAPSEVTPELVRELLGRPRVRPERAAEVDEVGVATGMYYTPAGGDIMFVESSLRRLSDFRNADTFHQITGWGNLSLILTGQLGDVMKESARAALTYAATHAERLDIPDERTGAVEVHIHVPAGAIPKDGPSAGVAMATALVSAMSGRPVRRDVAMTGEITLRGRVLPIGGIKEKVLGAHRAGIRHVILPLENEADLEDLPEEVRDALELSCVATLDEVLERALLPAPGEAVATPDVGLASGPSQTTH